MDTRRALLMLILGFAPLHAICATTVGRCAYYFGQISLKLISGDSLAIGQRVQVLSPQGDIWIKDAYFLGVSVRNDLQPHELTVLDADTGRIHVFAGHDIRLVDGNKPAYGIEFGSTSPAKTLSTQFLDAKENSCLALACLHGLATLKTKGARVPLLDGVDSTAAMTQRYDELVQALYRKPYYTRIDQQIEIEEIFKSQGLSFEHTYSHSRGEISQRSRESLRQHLLSGGVSLTTFRARTETSREEIRINHRLGAVEQVADRVSEPNPKGDYNHSVLALGLFEYQGQELTLVFDPNAQAYFLRPLDWLHNGVNPTDTFFSHDHYLVNIEKIK